MEGKGHRDGPSRSRHLLGPAAGAHKLALEVWPDNAPALQLYRKTGFVEEGRKVRHYRRSNGELWDSTLMGLHLDQEPRR